MLKVIVSRKPCLFTQWISVYNNICHYNGAMKHFGKDKGEEKLRLPGNRSIRVDGYVPEEKTIFEFYGCYWHSCPRCCPPHGKHEYKQLSFQFLFNQTMNKENSIKERGWKLQSIWECEWGKEMEEDPETLNFLNCMFNQTYQMSNQT
ncbi:unnamed protein product [Porites evermanni]|uniref:Uncharacterized protein n=1 Tax=Porites evermanni TaxID=104178 RepID=A0ABN8SN78_9CNID|nr:unnamed protein product [Porites evermanni]